MTQERWTAVDRCLDSLLGGPDEALDLALLDSTAAGLPAEAVSPSQGKLIHLLARVSGAQRILELGTLGGYSTIWLARALPPHGKLVTLEVSPDHAAVAQANIERAGLSGIVEMRIGPALATLSQLAEEGVSPFDFVFIDADKPNNPAYLHLVLKLSRPGTVIIGDNVVRGGAVADARSDDPKVQGVQRFLDLIAEHPRLKAAAVHTVGTKGYDGFVMAVVSE